jgi:multidrug transporter EmrE-like cation transporter
MAMNATPPLPLRPDGITFEIFLLVVGSALLHASWNLAARKTKGDLAVLTWGMALACACLAPALPFVPTTGPVLPALPFVVATGVAHIAYLVLLSLMYRHAAGSVSVVYPVARGTGVLGTTIMAGPILSEHVGAMGVVGIVLIVLGVGALGASKAGAPCLSRPLRCCCGRTGKTEEAGEGGEDGTGDGGGNAGASEEEDVALRVLAAGGTEERRTQSMDIRLASAAGLDVARLELQVRAADGELEIDPESSPLRQQQPQQQPQHPQVERRAGSATGDGHEEGGHAGSGSGGSGSGKRNGCCAGRFSGALGAILLGVLCGTTITTCTSGGRRKLLQMWLTAVAGQGRRK